MVNGRIKGANAERELADLLTLWAKTISINLTLARNLEQVRNGGCDLTGLEEFGLAVECKRCETLTINAWWGQAVRQASASQIPILAWKQSRTPWTFKARLWVYPVASGPIDVVMDAETFKKWFLARLVACRADSAEHSSR